MHHKHPCKIVDIYITVLNTVYTNSYVRSNKRSYCTLRGRDQRLKCAIISIFYCAVLYLFNFRKIQDAWANIARLGKYSTLGKTRFRRYLVYPAIKQ